MKKNTAKEVLDYIKSGQRIFVHGGASTPTLLLKELREKAGSLNDIEVYHLHTEGPPILADRALSKHLRIVNLFVGSNFRRHLDFDQIDYLPCFLSEIPALFRTQKIKLDVALIQVSPPDQKGFCSLGTSVDVARAAAGSATKILAQVNSKMPRVHGEGLIHIDKIHRWIEVDEDLPEASVFPPSEIETRIGRMTAGLVDNGATIQVGIGSVPNAILTELKNHKQLGVHTEMWSDGVLELIKSGAVDNSKKIVHPGKTVSSFVIGSRALYDFIHDNPSVIQLESDFVNSPAIIARNPKATSINSALEIDLTGQVCADSIGHQIVSGVGGQMDFIRGATLSLGGKPIIAITSRTKKGQSRIVSALKLGAGVVTTRAHVHYVVTEFGVADLYGKPLGVRAQELIKIAHPDDRAMLERQWHTIKKSVCIDNLIN